MDYSKLFYYDESSPSFLRRKTDWRSGKNNTTIRARAGDITGSLSTTKTKYYDVYAYGKLVRAHVVIWNLFHGEIPDGYCIDHFDRNSLNNSIKNLRLVKLQINAQNQSMKHTNKSGVTGVHLKDVGQIGERWVAQWNTLDSKRCQKSFSVNKYGDAAFELACNYRKLMIAELNLNGGNYTEGHGT